MDRYRIRTVHDSCCVSVVGWTPISCKGQELPRVPRIDRACREGPAGCLEGGGRLWDEKIGNGGKVNSDVPSR